MRATDLQFLDPCSITQGVYDIRVSFLTQSDNYGNPLAYQPSSKNRVGSFSRADRFAEMTREVRRQALVYVGPQSYDSSLTFNRLHQTACPVKMVSSLTQQPVLRNHKDQSKHYTMIGQRIVYHPSAEDPRLFTETGVSISAVTQKSPL